MSWNRYGPIVLCLVLVASTCGAEDPPKSDPALRIFTDLPVQIDPNSRYLFYLHGAII